MKDVDTHLRRGDSSQCEPFVDWCSHQTPRAVDVAACLSLRATI